MEEKVSFRQKTYIRNRNETHIRVSLSIYSSVFRVINMHLQVFLVSLKRQIFLLFIGHLFPHKLKQSPLKSVFFCFFVF